MDSSAQKVWQTVVIGGGIVGICSALALQQRGIDVLLFDPLDERARASYGNAGVVSCGSIFPIAGPQILGRSLGYLMGRDPSVRIRKRSLLASLPWARSFLDHCNVTSRNAAANQLVPFTRSAWPAHEALAQLVGTQALLRHTGWIRLYRDDAAWHAAARERGLLKNYGVALTDLTAAQLREIEPALSHRYAAGSMIDDAGAVRSPDALLRACYQFFSANGGVIQRGSCRELKPTGNTISVLGEGVSSGQSAIKAQTVVIAAGAWSGAVLKPLSAQLSIRLPLAAERGYHQHMVQIADGPL